MPATTGVRQWDPIKVPAPRESVAGVRDPAPNDPCIRACNPVERTNRVIKTMISQYVGKNHRSWDKHLPALQFAYNTAHQDSTGYSPAYLNFGREPHSAHIPPHRPNEPARTPAVHRQHLEETYELVRVNLARACQRQEKAYNLRRRAWKPVLGEHVWKREHPLSNKAAAFNAKLAPKYIGPLKVRKIISPVIVDLRAPGSK